MNCLSREWYDKPRGFPLVLAKQTTLLRKNIMPEKTLIPMEDGDRLTGKYLTFKLQTESYGIDVLKVREIIQQTSVMAMPQMPAHIRGVINLRGKIIPVMDLRKRLGLAVTDTNEQTCIMVVHVNLTEAKTTPMGLLVNGVEEVINISASEIEQPPHFGGRISTDYIIGIAKVKGAVKTLLDIDSIVLTDTMESPRLSTSTAAAGK